MALALDGSNTANNVAKVISCTLTTTSTNDLIIAVISTANGGGTGATFVGLSGWTQYFLESQGTNCGIMVFYTTSASTLSSQSIVATLGTTAEEPSTMTVFGVSGANLITPFDANVSLPASLGKSTSTATNAVTGVSTSNANDMIVQVTGLPNTSGGFTAGTIGVNTTTPIQSGSTYAGVQYSIVSSTQSSITCTANWTTNRFSISAVFGIQQASVVPTVSSSTLSLLGVG